MRVVQVRTSFVWIYSQTCSYVTYLDTVAATAMASSGALCHLLSGVTRVRVAMCRHRHTRRSLVVIYQRTAAKEHGLAGCRHTWLTVRDGRMPPD
ncbi:hypothetical protein BKA93DRAFT_377777 [Sparassis latifolia]